jgi:hypothetical protein
LRETGLGETETEDTVKEFAISRQVKALVLAVVASVALCAQPAQADFSGKPTELRQASPAARELGGIGMLLAFPALALVGYVSRRQRDAK